MEQIENFLYRELNNLSKMEFEPVLLENIEDEIFRILKTRKFRKYAINDDLICDIKEAINYDVKNRQPINITFLQGCYKLWRLNEAPESDWAELFAVEYYVQWVKNILAIYEPGVILDFYVDDLIMERISNYSRTEIIAYKNSFQKVLDLVKSFCPKNINFRITTVSSQYHSEHDFWVALNDAIEQNKDKPVVISESLKRTLLLNYRPINGESMDEDQMRDIIMMHNVHSALTKRLEYRKMPGKILAMPHHYNGCVDRIFLGSTKDSIVKYWIGVGVLRETDDGLSPTVLSPQQLETTKHTIFNVDLKNEFLMGLKNFRTIKVIEN